MTLPWKVALTGPTFCLTTASKPSSGLPVSSWQPGIAAFSTSALFSAAQTTARGAAIRRDPCISIASSSPLLAATVAGTPVPG